MLTSWFKRGAIAGLIASGVLAAAGPCQAGCCLFDWLFGRTTNYCPTPVVQNYNPCCNPCDPCNPCAATGVAAPTVVGYAPQVNYRFNWLRTPTYNYAAYAGVSPTLGCNTCASNPWQTYQYRLDRTPVNTFYAPTAAGCNTCASPVATASPCNSCSACSMGGTPLAIGTGVVPSSGCSSCAAGNAVTYAQPSQGAIIQQTTPGAVIQQTTPGAVIQQTTPGAYVTPGPATTTPSAADQQPTLNPGQFQQGSLRLETPTAYSADAQATLQVTPSGVAQPKLSPTVRPVPDPDADNAAGAPRLLDPRDRTAAAPLQTRPVAYITGVAQPAMPEIVAAPVSTPADQPQAAADEWDESGWYALKK